MSSVSPCLITLFAENFYLLGTTSDNKEPICGELISILSPGLRNRSGRGTPWSSVLDASGLVGYVAEGTSLLTIAKVSWSVSSQTDILWDATSNVVALSISGNGTYGFMPGQPAIANNGAAANVTGDVLITNGSASVGFIVIEYHKVPGATGLAWTCLLYTSPSPRDRG